VINLYAKLQVLVVNLLAKFGVSRLNGSGDMEEVPKIIKVGYVTPLGPPLT